jgi:glucosyl-3-phosphoglycerate synthase
MEYVQERIATLHDFGNAHPAAPTDRATVVVPLTERDHTTLAAERVLSTLEGVDPDRVLIALRADERRVADVVSWVESFDLSSTVLWCTAPRLEARLAEEGLDGTAGKGRDVWLGLGPASDSEYVVVHDTDAMTYDATHVPRLLFPLARDYEFVKGYYARVENDRLYGRLLRLFYAPVVRALANGAADRRPVTDGGDLLAYLGAFRYALAGEFATTGALARRLRAPRGWGLEVGTLGDALDATGFAGTAQVDLGVYEHDHRSIGGHDGLGEMCGQVGATLFTILEEHGIEPDYEVLPERYRNCARTLVEQYAADAAFNGFAFDRQGERAQIDQYATTIRPPAGDDRLPAWRDADLDPATVASLSAAAIEEHND